MNYDNLLNFIDKIFYWLGYGLIILLAVLFVVLVFILIYNFIEHLFFSESIFNIQKENIPKMPSVPEKKELRDTVDYLIAKTNEAEENYKENKK